MKLLNRRATTMEISNKSYFLNVKTKINIDNVSFLCEYHIVYYNNDGKWKLDMYELLDILEIEIKISNETRLLDNHTFISGFINFYKNTFDINYYDIISNLLDEEFKALSEIELKKLNKDI